MKRLIIAAMMLGGEMGFRGYVVPDSDAVEYLYTKHGTAKDMKEAVRQSVEDYPNRLRALECQKTESAVTASTNSEDAPKVLDENNATSWQGNKGEYITFALGQGRTVNSVSIAFTRDNPLPASFEIQLSGGGGQFLTVYSGTVSEYGKPITYTFKGTTASDLRILLNDDRVGIAEVKW